MGAFLKSTFLTVVFIFIIFTPPIRFLPYYTWLLALFGLYTLTKPDFKNQIGFSSTYNLNFLNLLALVIVFNCIIVPVLHGFADFSYIPLNIGIVLTLFRNILLIYVLSKFSVGDILAQYCKYFLIACCIYVSFTLFFIVYPDLKQFWINDLLTNVEDKSEEYAVYAFRYSLDGFAGFGSATIFSFACLLCCYLVSLSHKVRIIPIVCLIIMVIGCFFYGRVSLFGMLLGAILIIWISDSLVKTAKIVSIIIILIIGILGILNIASQSNELLLAWQDWAFSIIKQLFVEKEVTDYSVTHMVEDMYYMPDFFTILFGDGIYTNPDGTYYGHTDVGFMRLILYGGIIGLILVYSLLIYLATITVKISKSVAFKHFIFLSVILFFIMEMKGEAFQRALMMLYPLFLIQQYRHNSSTFV